MINIHAQLTASINSKKTAISGGLYKSENGGSLVEFALIAPLLLLITFGIIEFGVMMFNQQIITNAAREGARRGIVQANPRISATEIANTVHTVADSRLLSFLASPAPPSITVTCNGASGVCPNANAFGQDLAVTVQYNFHYLVLGNMVPGLGSSINLHSTATMKCE